jgi:adenine-specific DNA-methyltransferase
MRRLLTDNGSIFIHLDYHIGHYIKLIMDEIFGNDNSRNEIIVERGRKKGLMYQFEKVDRMHTTTPYYGIQNHPLSSGILLYSKDNIIIERSILSVREIFNLKLNGVGNIKCLSNRY